MIPAAPSVSRNVGRAFTARLARPGPIRHRRTCRAAWPWPLPAPESGPPAGTASPRHDPRRVGDSRDEVHAFEDRASGSSDRIVAAEGYLDRNVYWSQLAPDRQIPAGPYDRAPGGPLQEPCVGKGVEHVTAVVRAQVPQACGLREGQLETRHLDEFRSHAIDDTGEAHARATSNLHAIRTSAGVCAYVDCFLNLVVSSLPRRIRICRYTSVLL